MKEVIKYLFFIGLFFFLTDIFSQVENDQSLENLFSTSKSSNDTLERPDFIFAYIPSLSIDSNSRDKGKNPSDLYRIYNSTKVQNELNRLIEIDKSQQYGDSLMPEKINRLKRIAALYWDLGNKELAMDTELKVSDMYFKSGQLDIAESITIDILKKYKGLRGHAYNNAYYLLSVFNRYMGNLNKSLKYSLICVNNVNKEQDSIVTDYFYGELALVYDDLDLTEKSIEWYRKCLELRKNKSDASTIYKTAGFLIQQLLKNNEKDEASTVLKYIMNDITPKSNYDKSNLLQTIANYYDTLKEYDKAEKYYEQTIQLDAFKFDNEFATKLYNEVGSLYISINNFEKSGKYLNMALKNANGTGIGTLSYMRDIHQKLYKVDSLRGNYISAIEHLLKYQSIKDTIFNVAKSRQIEELLIQYETNNKEQNIKLLENEAKLQESKLSNVTTMRNWQFGALIVFFIIIFLLFNRYKLKQRTYKKLQEQQQEINNKNISLQHLVGEKEWLLKEIHHRVKNNLQTIIGLLHTQSQFLKSEEALTAYKDSQHRIESMSLLNQKLFYSKDFSTVDMSSYIHELIDYLKHSFDVGQRIHFSLGIEPIKLKISHSLPLGLILNEAITNAIKYAFPAKRNGLITITLKHIEALQYKLIIVDNGDGLPVNFELKKNSTMGITLMEGLSEDIGGQFFIKNKNEGVEITILFSYDFSINDDLPIQKTEISLELI
tara:strand:+ start:17797 stop:19947 length:2151 start_codon:yes stop_codon:yes gene_type:complete